MYALFANIDFTRVHRHEIVHIPQNRVSAGEGEALVNNSQLVFRGSIALTTAVCPIGAGPEAGYQEKYPFDGR